MLVLWPLTRWAVNNIYVCDFHWQSLLACFDHIAISVTGCTYQWLRSIFEIRWLKKPWPSWPTEFWLLLRVARCFTPTIVLAEFCGRLVSRGIQRRWSPRRSAIFVTQLLIFVGDSLVSTGWWKLKSVSTVQLLLALLPAIWSWIP